MAEIWLASAAALMALGCLVSLVIGAIRDREIKETLEFLVNENDELKKSLKKIYEQTARDVALIKFSMSCIERKIRK